VTKATKPVIEVKDVKIHFSTDEGLLKAVDGVDFTICQGATLGLVGESGCGKSVTAHALLHIIPPRGHLLGEILYHKKNGNGSSRVIDIAKLKPTGQEVRALRGKDISMIFQEPMTSFSPVHTIGNQLTEAILLHRTPNKQEARDIAIDMLRRVGITNPQQRFDEYPQQLSGGMRQRAMIAMALSCHPAVLIADEPTTALDVTIQAQVLELMQALQHEFGMAILFITHDLGVIAEMVNEVAVMYLGKIVEFGTVAAIFDAPRHPYTRALLQSIPRLGKTTSERLASIKGAVPVPIDLPEQCPFYERCTEAFEQCTQGVPPTVTVDEGHTVRCFHYV